MNKTRRRRAAINPEFYMYLSKRPSLLLAALLLAACNNAAIEKDKPLKADGNTDIHGHKDPETKTDEEASIDIITEETCNDKWPEFCDEDNVAHFCGESGRVTIRDCKLLSAPGSVCKKQADNNFVDCVFPCDPNNWHDFTSCQGDYVAAHVCLKTTDGDTDYAEFSFTNNPCTFGCRDGVCLSGQAPTEGAACKEATFASNCYGNDYYLCQNSVIVKESCGGQTVCAKAFGDKNPQCTTSCAGTGSGDRYSCNGNNLDNHVCRVGMDGNFYYFHETTACSSFCKTGVCDTNIPRSGASCDYHTMKDVCAHNTLYYCNTETGMVDTMICGQGEMVGSPLCRYLTNSYADCVNPGCDPNDPESAMVECDTGKDASGAKFKYIYGFECEQGLDGDYYLFNIEEKCSGDCKSGVCL